MRVKYLPTKTTCATVNAVFMKRGLPIRIYRAREGYYYFMVESEHCILLDSLYTYTIADMAAKDIADDAEKEYHEKLSWWD